MIKAAYTLIFGLTADPIHKGHEQVILNSFQFAEDNNLNFNEFLLVPTYQPNLIVGKKQPRTSFQHRFNMCQLVADYIINMFNYAVYVSDIEKYLFDLNQQKSYSYDTLQAIDSINKLFVLSADHFAGRWPKFRKWYRWQQLVKENGLMIHQRPGHRINHSFIEQLRDLNPHIYVVTGLPSINVSSTQIRTELSNNNNTSTDLVSASVLGYITKHNLYEKN